MKLKTNLISGVFFLVASIGLILLTPSQVAIPAFKTRGPSPRVIPYIILGGMAICSVILIIQSLLSKEEIVEYDFSKEKAALKMIGLMVGFATLMITLGFLVAIYIILPAMLYIYGERKPTVYFFTLLGGTVVYLLFTLIFNISLPGIGGY